MVTFDENHTYDTQNSVGGIHVGDAVPAKFVGTRESTLYKHYSDMATVGANWNLQY